PPGLGRFDTFLLLGANLALLTTNDWLYRGLDALAALANPGAQLLGTDVAVDGTEPAPSALRVRATHDGEDTGWSCWEGGRPYVAPERLGDLLHGSPWRADDIRRVGGDGYLARLRLRRTTDGRTRP
ncbi:MAG TPA: hypothetical protein VGD67_04145, partial [Pseudonocardiaceae bacterium]